MNRLAIIVAAIMIVAAVSALMTVLIVPVGKGNTLTMSDQQKAAREKLFGSGKNLPPMRQG